MIIVGTHRVLPPNSVRSPMKVKALRARAASLAVGAAVLTMAAGMIAAPAAFADGTSSTTHGCYSTWGSTGGSSHCYNITGDYRVATALACADWPDTTSDYTTIEKGSTVPNFGQVDCHFSATSAHPLFKSW